VKSQRVSGLTTQEAVFSRSVDAKDELAPEMAGLAESMGLGSLGQPIELDLGRGEQRLPDIAQQYTREADDYAQREASDRQQLRPNRPPDRQTRHTETLPVHHTVQ
jgi:hypothetical protein